MALQNEGVPGQASKRCKEVAPKGFPFRESESSNPLGGWHLRIQYPAGLLHVQVHLLLERIGALKSQLVPESLGKLQSDSPIVQVTMEVQ